MVSTYSSNLLPRDVEDELEEQDPELLRFLRRRRKRELDKKYPKPTENDIKRVTRRLDARFEEKIAEIDQIRDVRHLRDRLPDAWAKGMLQERRYHAGFVANEIRSIVAIITGNRPKITVQPAGSSNAAGRRADSQTRWANALIPALERVHGQLLRPFADSLVESEFAAFEFYLSGDYDDLPEELVGRKTVEDTRSEYLREREETDAEYRKRTMPLLTQVGLPFCVRVPDPLSVRFEEDEKGISLAYIREQKPYTELYEWTMDNLTEEQIDALRLPSPGVRGIPATAGFRRDVDGNVETVRYYDRRWMVYMVGNKIIQCEEHGLPGVPIIIAKGMVSSSDETSDQLQGYIPGIVMDEVFTNDLMTFGLDEAYRFRKPHLAIQAKDANAKMPQPGPDNRPPSINLNQDSAPFIPPGWEVTDVTKDHQPKEVHPILGVINQIRTGKSLNQVAKGQSPGADPSGYAVHALISSSTRDYQVYLESLARAVGQLVDFARLAIRDSKYLRDLPVYLSVPMADTDKGGTEWLGLSKDDIDETPADVHIDPLDAQNRMAKTQWLMNLRHEGAVSKRYLQVEGAGIEDPERMDDEIDLEAWDEFVEKRAMEDAWSRINAQPPVGGGGPPGAAGGGPDALIDQYGNPIGGGMQAAGAIPASPQPPSVGPQGAQDGANLQGVPQRMAAGARPANQGPE